MAFETSELILNPDGSIYHLNLKPENLASTVITVGDPDRVETVASFFDEIEFKTQKREFHTQTGTYKGKRITVISTGIGTDNIDIVMNELDALVNIDLATRNIKTNLTALEIVRIGTSGTIQKDIPMDAFLASKTAIGFDGLLQYYENEPLQNNTIATKLKQDLQLANLPYVVDCDPDLKTLFSGSPQLIFGTTATNCGFYAPQGRYLRAKPADTRLLEKMMKFQQEGNRITNLEMETSGIYGMAQLLGHRAISMNAIIANRATGKFSKDPEKTIKNLIAFCLKKIALL